MKSVTQRAKPMNLGPEGFFLIGLPGDGGGESVSVS